MSKLTKSNYPMIDCMKFVVALLVLGVSYSEPYHHLWYIPLLIFSFDPEFRK